ncbi:MAG: class I SAM-dependent methyltransferase [Chloroflexi bacterium]|nr:class I SAM-dependent methyltransferase [Chloroflexota bacterium]
MPFREAFDCLWCGRAHRTRSGEDLEGWAGLCPDCVGRAADNGFLRFRLRTALQERSRASGGLSARSDSASAPAAALIDPARASASESALDDPDAAMKVYYAARAPEYDAVYRQGGGGTGGSVLDLWFQRELDEITGWLDQVPLRGEIVELAAGTGWWSPLLAQKGELSIYDITAEPLDIARGRLLAHGLRAHIHVRDAWQEPDRQVDGVFCGFWLSHVRRARLGNFLALVARWLRQDGLFAFLDERAGTAGADPEADPETGMTVRRLDDGREFRIPKVYYAPDELEEALREAGFGRCEVRQTERYFLMGTAVR